MQTQKQFMENFKFGAIGGFALGLITMFLAVVSQWLSPFVTFTNELAGMIPFLGSILTLFNPLTMAFVGGLIAVVGVEVYGIFKLDKHVKDRMVRTIAKFVLGVLVLDIAVGFLTSGTFGLEVLMAGIVAFIIGAVVIALFGTVIYNNMMHKSAPI